MTFNLVEEFNRQIVRISKFYPYCTIKFDVYIFILHEKEHICDTVVINKDTNVLDVIDQLNDMIYKAIIEKKKHDMVLNYFSSNNLIKYMNRAISRLLNFIDNDNVINVEYLMDFNIFDLIMTEDKDIEIVMTNYNEKKLIDEYYLASERDYIIKVYIDDNNNISREFIEI
jgi:hypothetical protein